MFKTAVTLGVCLSVAILAVGCATAPKGPTDEQQVQSVLQQWSELLPAKNIDQLMTLYSDNFKSDRGDKKAVAGFLKENTDYLDGAKVDLTTTKVIVTKETATATPVGLSGTGFNVDLGLEFAKEDGKWMIIGMGGA